MLYVAYNRAGQQTSPTGTFVTSLTSGATDLLEEGTARIYWRAGKDTYPGEPIDKILPAAEE